MALRAKCGFMSAPGTRISRRVAAGDTEGGEISRTDAARESYPYVTAFGAQNASPPTSLLYPLIVGTSYQIFRVSKYAVGKLRRYHWHN